MMNFSQFRFWAVLIIGLWVGVGESWSKAISKHAEIVWVFEQLEQYPVGSYPELGRWIEHAKVTIPELEARKFLGGFKQEFDVGTLTIRNPDYWRSVIVLKEDGILLLWLHALLLEQRSESTEALGWALLMRQFVSLTEDFDHRWIAWERHVLATSEMGQAFRREFRHAMLGVQLVQDAVPGLIVVRSASGGMTPKRQEGPVLRSEASYEVRINGNSAVGDFPLPAVWATLRSLSLIETAPGDYSRISEILSTNWPFISLVAQDEMSMVATWLEKHGFGAESLACVLMAENRSDGVNSEQGARLFGELIGQKPGAELFEVMETQPIFTVKVTSFVNEDRFIHPYLMADATQLLRRLEGMHANNWKWGLSLYDYYRHLAFNYLRIQEGAELDTALKGLTRASSNSDPALIDLRIRRSMLQEDPQEVLRWLEKLKRVDRKRIEHWRTPSSAAMYLGDWQEAARIFTDRCATTESDGNWAMAGYAALHAHLAGQMAGDMGSEKLKEVQQKLPDDSWVRRLGQAALGEITASELWAGVEGRSEFETAGRRCEAHTVLAFKPGGSMALRREHLLAGLATGRTDFVEYHMAQYALRDLDAGE